MCVSPISLGVPASKLTEAKIVVQHLARYLSLTSPINARYWLCFFVFSFLFLSLYMRPLYNIGTLLEKDKICQRGIVLIYNLAIAKPRGVCAWHIIKNGCIVGGTRFCRPAYFGEWQALKNTSLSQTQEYLK